ncbi:unnamed protein product [Caenorhabditis sp. 36 PRJEB53466]|nr:unnamed protein product [Caenorhabditis sp. 36 PRJEB53466]
MRLLCSLVAILLIGHFVEAFKIRNALKTVVKRFGLEMKTIELFDEMNLREPFDSATDEQVAEIKKDHAILVTTWLRGQASSQNDNWKVFSDQFVAVLDKDVTVDICGVTPFGYVQFVSYLDRDRQKWKKNLVKDDSMYEILPSKGREEIKMRTSFKQESYFGYFSTQIYEITLHLTFPKIGGNVLFTISEISVKGGCTEFGQMNVTNSHSTDEELWNAEDIDKFLMLFTPRPFRGELKNPERLPVFWLGGLEKNEYLTATVCNRETSESRKYTDVQFRRWYELFGRMWHPKENNTDFVKIQEIKRNEVQIMARITYRLVIGLDWDGKATETDWNFRITADFSKHGGREWLISMIDVPCPPRLNMLEASYEAYRNITGLTLVSMIPFTKRVYQDLGFLKYLVQNHSKIEIYNCGGEHMETLDEVEKKFWTGNYSATFLERVAIDTSEKDLAKEDTYFTMIVSLGTYEKFNTSEESHGDRITRLEATWHFYIQWDEVDQFYYIKKIEFGCPKQVQVLREFPWPYRVGTFFETWKMINFYGRRFPPPNVNSGSS